MLYLFFVPDHQERDIKLSIQVPHILKLMARWKKRTLLQIRRLNALLCSTEEYFKMFYKHWSPELAAPTGFSSLYMSDFQGHE